MLRPATPTDFPAIRDVVYQVWPIAYREMITQEQIAYMLTMMYSDESLMRQVTEEQCVFLVYESPDRIEGFASYSDLGNGIYKLHKLYVYTTMHGKGLGKVLLQEVKEAVVRAGGSSIELQVNKRNVAQHFYRKHGFEIEQELVLDIGDGFVMDDFIMRWKVGR